MHFDSEFRRPEGGAKLLEAIRGMEMPAVRMMEVCGTHTAAISENGIPSLLPSNIRLISGPGCPVCVTVSAYIDRLIELATAHRDTDGTPWPRDETNIGGQKRGDSAFRDGGGVSAANLHKGKGTTVVRRQCGDQISGFHWYSP